MRISHPGSKAQYTGDTRNHGLQHPYVYVVCWVLRIEALSHLKTSMRASLKRSILLMVEILHGLV